MPKKGYALISGHPGGVTLGKYQGMMQDLSTLFVNIKPWMGDWIAFVLSKQDLRGKMRGICSAIAILWMKRETSAISVFERTGNVQLVNTFWQNGDRKDVSLVFCSF